MTQFAYVVYGETSSYDDKTTWNVMAFIHEVAAAGLVERLIRIAEALKMSGTICGSKRVGRFGKAAKAGLKQLELFDPQVEYDDMTGIDYGYFKVPLDTQSIE